MVREGENQGGVRGRICRCEVRRQTKEKDGSEERSYTVKARKSVRVCKDDKRCKNRIKAGGRNIKGSRVSYNHTYGLPGEKKVALVSLNTFKLI